MFITCPDGEGLVKLLESNNIKATLIGTVTANRNERLLISEKDGTTIIIESPGPDELYKVK